MRELKSLSEERGFRLVTVFSPHLRELLNTVDQARHERLVHSMDASGLDPVSLDGVFSGRDLSAVRLAPWDTHLSVWGNELVADELHRVLREGYPQLFGAGLAGSSEYEATTPPAPTDSISLRRAAYSGDQGTDRGPIVR